MCTVEDIEICVNCVKYTLQDDTAKIIAIHWTDGDRVVEKVKISHSVPFIIIYILVYKYIDTRVDSVRRERRFLQFCWYNQQRGRQDGAIFYSAHCATS